VLLFVVRCRPSRSSTRSAAPWRTNIRTFDLNLRPGRSFAVAGRATSRRFLIAIRTYRLVFHPEQMAASPTIKRWNDP